MLRERSVGNVYPDPRCVQLKPGYNPAILNPYYAMSPQPLLDRNAWYPVGLDFGYLSPNVASLVVNYKRNKFTITPALTFNEGQPYGNPADVYGNDPRVCTGNSSKIPSAKSPLQADYTTCFSAATQNGTSPGSLYIPNPQTGSFDGFGAYRQPSQLNLSMTVGYQLTPAIKVNLLAANLVNACFGGSVEPWTKQFPPNGYTCGYIPNFYYVRISTTARRRTIGPPTAPGSTPPSRSRSFPPTPIRTRSSFRIRSTCICNSTSKFSPSAAHAARAPLRMTGYSSGFL